MRERLIPRFIVEYVEKRGNLSSGDRFLLVSIADQKLYLCRDGAIGNAYPVSTGAAGGGCRKGSFQTPIGLHRICEKIGEGEPEGMVFVGRVPTGKIVRPDEPAAGEDIITTRILRLEGLEEGINRGNGVDTFERLVYIHGTPHEAHIGEPVSHGCIRMINGDILALFNEVREGTLLLILPDAHLEGRP